MSDKKATGFLQTGEPIPELDEVLGHTKNSLKKIHMPIDDAYIMGKIPQVKAKVNATIDKVKTRRYLREESIAKLEELRDDKIKATQHGRVGVIIDRIKTQRYLCEESIAALEELKEELHKL